VPRSSDCTERHPAPPRRLISERIGVPERDFQLDLAPQAIPKGTTLAVMVTPDNRNGGVSVMQPLSGTGSCA